jgi:hypothetical protein
MIAILVVLNCLFCKSHEEIRQTSINYYRLLSKATMVTSVTETATNGNARNFCWNLARHEFLVKTHNMKLHKNPSSGSQVASCTRTDRWTHGQNTMQVAADFTIKKKIILKMVNYFENVQSEAWGGRLLFTGQTHYRTYRDEVRQYLRTTTLHSSASDADNSHDSLKSQKHVLWCMTMLLRTCNFLNIKCNV